MLVLSAKMDDVIWIDGDRIYVREIKNGCCKLGFDFSPDTVIMRDKVRTGGPAPQGPTPDNDGP